MPSLAPPTQDVQGAGARPPAKARTRRRQETPAPVRTYSAPATDLTAAQQDALHACATALGDPPAFAAWLREYGAQPCGWVADDYQHPLAAWLTANAGVPIAVGAASYRLAGERWHVERLPDWAFRFCEALRQAMPAQTYGTIGQPVTGTQALRALQASNSESPERGADPSTAREVAALREAAG